MAKKTIEFERLQLSESKLIQKFETEKRGFMQLPEQMLAGLERFHDIWMDNQEILKAHPAIFRAFNQAVTELADGYLKTGHLQEFNEDERPRIRLNITRFRDTVAKHYELLVSEEVGKAKSFVEGTTSSAGKKHTVRAKTGSTVQEKTSIEPSAEIESGASDRIVEMTINVSRGGTVFINNVPGDWSMNTASQTAGEIAAKGAQRRGGRKRSR